MVFCDAETIVGVIEYRSLSHDLWGYPSAKNSDSDNTTDEDDKK